MTDDTRLQDLDPRLLRLFLAVHAANSMTDAARELGLTQSAVSQAVSRLERLLDLTLINRGQRPMVPTAAGDVLAAHARDLMTRMDTLVADVRAAGRADRPRVRLGLIDSVAGTIGADLIRAIRSEVREVSVWSGISPNLRHELARGRLDLVVTSDPTVAAETKPRRLLREPFIAVAPASVRLPEGPVEPMRLSERLPLVRYSRRSVIGDEIERELNRRNEYPPRVFEFDGSDGVFAMVSGGLGWAITTPLCLAHGRMFGRDIVVRPLSGRAMMRNVHLLAANAVGAGLAARTRAEAMSILESLVARVIHPLAPDAAAQIRIG